MRLTTVLLAIGLEIATAWGQSPSIVAQTQQKLTAVQQQQTAASNNALAAAQGQTATTATPAAKPPAAAPASNAKKPQVTIVPMATPKETGGKRVAKVNPVKPPSQPPAKPAEATVPAAENKPPADETKKDEPKAFTMTGRRDPFISPVVGHISGGSGCSGGKRCLAVDQIVLTGIVKSDNGMIAIVVNALNKAYFLRENDPVFNGYVVKITGDSIVFKETIQDDLGKPLTREITKKIMTPAV